MSFIIGILMGIYIGMVISMVLTEDIKKDCKMCPHEDTDKCKACKPIESDSRTIHISDKQIPTHTKKE